MADFLRINDLGDGSLSVQDIVEALSSESELFFFAYSPLQKSLIAWTKNSERVLGVKDVSIARDGNLFLRHVHPDDRFLLLTDLETALKGESPYRATYRWVRPDNNEVRWLHCRASLQSRFESKLFEGLIIDLSHEFTGSVGRMAGPDSVETVLAAFPTIVFTVDSDLRLLRINRPRQGMNFNFGDQQFRPELFKIGRPLLSCFDNPEQRAHLESVALELLDGKSRYHRTRISVENSIYSMEITPLSDSGSISGLLFVITDITEMVRLERQLSELQRTEGLRLLAAGVAHNFNNALQSIVGQAAAIRSHPDNHDVVISSSQSIIEIVGQASQLARQLDSFEGSSKGSPQPVDLNLCVMAALNKIDDLFSAGVKIGVAFGNPPPVLAQQEQLSEALEEILRNARESMSNGGNLSIKTYVTTLGALEVENLPAGRYAKLSVHDSGSGMNAETRERCFAPFFTTKDRDPATGVSLKGKGLGLSHALAIIRSFGGGISIDSQPNIGTSVAIYLPLAEATEANASDSLGAAQQSPDIMVVDDDLMVLRTMESMLNDLGYSVVTTDDPRQALAIARTSGRDLKVALIDAIMPGMDGASLTRQLLRGNKQIVAIGFSGAPAEQTKLLIEAGAKEILRKPVTPQTLANLISRYISRSSTQQQVVGS
ncbi:MAG: response regulator [Oligoflexia bacterium]|nr:response regulator [Oligoflexia bacterium]